jgi:hypothetical protein
MVGYEPRVGTPSCLSEVFILLGLDGAVFVSAVDTRLTDTHVAEIGEI